MNEEKSAVADFFTLESKKLCLFLFLKSKKLV